MTSLDGATRGPNRVEHIGRRRVLDSRDEIADGLSRLLSDTYTLYLKTHNYHWNVTGPMFHTLHLMFETQYNELALAVDLIAERIRATRRPCTGELPRVRPVLRRSSRRTTDPTRPK